MKKLVSMAVLLLLWSGSVTVAQEEPVVIDGIVARVNRDIITLSAYRRAQQELLDELRRQGLTGQQLDEQYQKALKELLQDLIDTQLLVQKADELGINVEAQINEYILKLAEQNGFPPSKADEMLRQMGLDPDQARQLLRVRFLREAVIGREVYPKVFQNIFDKDVEAYYKEHINQYAEPSAVKLSEIFIKIGTRTRDQAERLAQQLMEQIKAGADFASLAKQHSDGPSASTGGDLGWFNLDPHPELGEGQRKAIEGKQVGQVTDLIELSDGFRIFRIDDHREKKEKPLTPELRREVSMRIAQQRAQPAIQEYIKQLRKDAYVEIAGPYRSKEEAATNH
ncbi:MAG: peptidylprolyl isomerase [Acidobacteria bacterium]|nr:peptidylprolyl isomerase [Acidobacteriota bacterium]